MKFAFNYIFVLIWLAYLISSGVYLFSKGFLLSRISQKDISTCRKLSEDWNEEYYLNRELVQEIFKDVNASSSLCLPKKSKLIILVIDALKYEFGAWNHDTRHPLPYENKMPIFTELLTLRPNHTRLLKFRADPPTTTLQRLKGLTTGSLPTFIDIGSNFATPEINEDNIIDQIVNNRLAAVFLGDSTWTELYPKRFKREYSYPSFDIFDLDTVDNKILKHLPNELANDDWDVLIAHFLGVDHCGHKHGPIHSEMTRKLTEMDRVIRTVVEEMDEDATLIVMGDHGMTITGDHGGDSNDEVYSMLFAHSKVTRLVSNDFGLQDGIMQQIDLVPTLSAILGVPIPYSNLGLINLNVLPETPVPHMAKYQVLLLHAWQNAKQIYKYFYGYALENKRTFQYDEMEAIENKVLILTHRVNTVYSEMAFRSLIKDLNSNLREILEICRSIWVKFDANQMSQGLLMTFLPIFFSFLLIHNSRAIQYSKIFTSKTIAFIYLTNISVGILGYRYYKDLSMRTEEHSILFVTNILSTFILAFLTVQNWPEIALNWSHMKRFDNLPTRVIFLVSVSVFFSNSFIVQEQKILSYLLIGLIIIALYELVLVNTRLDLKTNFKWTSFLKSVTFRMILMGIFAIVLLRLSYSLFKCREEQGNCTSFTENFDFFQKGKHQKLHILTVVVLVLHTTLTRIYLRSCGNLTGFSVNVVLARYGPTVAAICAGGHILLAHSAIKNIERTHIDAMAWMVYGLFALQLIILPISPLMAHVLQRKSNTTISVDTSRNIIPEIFKKMKQMYEGDDRDRQDDVPIVYGLATTYSSTLISFSVFLALVLAILLGAKASLGIFLCIGVATALLIIHSTLRYRTSNSLESCLQPSFTMIVSWFLLEQFCFYATSHQPTMSQIDWRAAFVGRSAKFDNSNFISGILVILNTFCGQILFSILYPLLNSETFTLYALFPNLKPRVVKKKKVIESNFHVMTIHKSETSLQGNMNDFDIKHGELMLYENEEVFIGSVFKLACQIFMLQGIRVFCAMMACTIHCRHLMVWKIFAPRFIYEGLATYVTLPALIFGYLIIVRVHLSVSRLISKIKKMQ